MVQVITVLFSVLISMFISWNLGAYGAYHFGLSVLCLLGTIVHSVIILILTLKIMKVIP
jgi:hypothetical protein